MTKKLKKPPYESAGLEVIYFTSADIVTASGDATGAPSSPYSPEDGLGEWS